VIDLARVGADWWLCDRIVGRSVGLKPRGVSASRKKKLCSGPNQGRRRTYNMPVEQLGQFVE